VPLSIIGTFAVMYCWLQPRQFLSLNMGLASRRVRRPTTPFVMIEKSVR